MEGCAVAGLSVIRKYISSKNENTLRCKMWMRGTMEMSWKSIGNVLFCTEEASIDNIV